MSADSKALHAWDWRQSRDLASSQAQASLTREIELLYDAHSASLLRFALGATADSDFASESVQEVFLLYAEFRQRESPPPQPLTWLLKCLRERIARKTRDHDRRADGKIDDYLPASDPAPNPEDLAAQSEARRLMDRVAAPRELECMLLRAEGLSYEEIAAVMGISSGAVGAMIYRVGRKIQDALHATDGFRS